MEIIYIGFVQFFQINQIRLWKIPLKYPKFMVIYIGLLKTKYLSIFGSNVIEVIRFCNIVTFLSNVWLLYYLVFI